MKQWRVAKRGSGGRIWKMAILENGFLPTCRVVFFHSKKNIFFGNLWKGETFKKFSSVTEETPTNKRPVH